MSYMAMIEQLDEQDRLAKMRNGRSVPDNSKRVRLIDATALREVMKNEECDCEVFPWAVDNAPTVDAVKVVHGRWIEGKCSNCNTVFTVEVYGEVFELREIHSNYCPNCGAKMDGKESSE